MHRSRASGWASAGSAGVAGGPAGPGCDDLAAQGRAAGPAVDAAGEDACRAQQVVGDRGAQDPGVIGAESPRGDVCERSVDEVGEHGLDHSVFSVGDVGVDGGLGGIGEERVIPVRHEALVSYSRHSREELEGRFLGLMTYP